MYTDTSNLAQHIIIYIQSLAYNVYSTMCTCNTRLVRETLPNTTRLPEYRLLYAGPVHLCCSSKSFSSRIVLTFPTQFLCLQQELQGSLGPNSSSALVLSNIIDHKDSSTWMDRNLSRRPAKVKLEGLESCFFRNEIMKYPESNMLLWVTTNV